MSDAYSMLLRDVMVSDVHSVGAEDSLHTVLDSMLENGLATLPVVDEEGRCVGMIAAVDLLAPTHALDTDLQTLAKSSQEDRGDFVEVFERSGLSECVVQDFMSTRVVSAAPTTTLPDAANKMLQNQIHHLVVLGPDSRLQGIVSTMDILEAFAQHQPLA